MQSFIQTKFDALTNCNGVTLLQNNVIHIKFKSEHIRTKFDALTNCNAVTFLQNNMLYM